MPHPRGCRPIPKAGWYAPLLPKPANALPGQRLARPVAQELGIHHQLFCRINAHGLISRLILPELAECILVKGVDAQVVLLPKKGMVSVAGTTFVSFSVTDPS